jgi:2-dehydropantoate 2-reductase
MKILVLGAGGVGGYFGGRLAASGADVAFLVREGRREQLQRDGLVIESALGNLKTAVRTVTAGELVPGYDLAILTCKSYDLEDAMDAVAPVMDGKCALLPLLNGIEHLEKLDARFSHDSVLGGSCHIAAMLASDGVIKHLNDLHRIMFGERDKSVTPRIRAIEDAFAGSGVEARLSSDIMLEMWEKIAFLSALAGMTCLMRANVGEIARTPDGAELMQRYFLACVQIATKCGHPPRMHVVQRMNEIVTERDSLATASMLRDLEGGGRVEADHIVGYMLRKARELYIDDGLLTVAYTHLKAYEERRAAKRLP